MKGKTQVILVLLLFVAALLGIGALTYSNRVEVIDTELVKTVERDKSPVQIQETTLQTLTETLVATGVLGAEQDVVLSAEVGGRVKKVTKSLGDRCEKGTLFVKLDAESYRLAVQQAKANLAQAEVNLKYADREWQRMSKLKQSEVASVSQVDSVEGAYSASKAAVATAKTAVALAVKNLKETSIRCPFTGFIAERMVDSGAMVAPSTPLARLVDTTQLTVTLSVTSDQLARLQVGQNAVLFDPALSGRTYTGKVLRLGIAADSRTRTFPVEVAVTEPEGMLRTGQVVQAELALETHENVIAIPRAAVLDADKKAKVMIVKGGRAKVISVQLGPSIEQNVIIKRGLNPKDQVVVIGQEELSDGDEVEITGRVSAEGEPEKQIKISENVTPIPQKQP